LEGELKINVPLETPVFGILNEANVGMPFSRYVKSKTLPPHPCG
jgi:hypothetical protein